MTAVIFQRVPPPTVISGKHQQRSSAAAVIMIINAVTGIAGRCNHPRNPGESQREGGQSNG